ncbi:MAG TPA: hypothetical protein VF273_03700 [Pelobium sp.]
MILKNQFVKYILLSVMVLTCGSACKKNGQEPPTDKKPDEFGKIAYFAQASGKNNKLPASTNKGVKVMADAQNTVAVDWSSASVWVEKISFTGKNTQVLDTTIMVKKKLNIFNSGALMGVIKLPAGAYKDINVKMYCRKNSSEEFGIDFLGMFTNTRGEKDSLMVRSSIDFDVAVKVNDIVLNPADNYKATFNFDLAKVLTGISNLAIENNLKSHRGNLYVIWKGGSQDIPFYNQIIQNWQNVASITITKEGANPDWK